jgi:hypothetical protein
LAWTARRGGWRAVLAWGAGAMVVVALLAAGLAFATQPKQVDPDWRSHVQASAVDTAGLGNQTLASIFAPSDPACLKIATGVSGPADLLDTLELAPGKTPKDRALSAYARQFYATPVYSHLTWAVAALAIAVLLLLRRRPGDGAMAGLQLGALAFAASLPLTAVGCHYRNLYLVDLAAFTGLIWLALDPPFLGRRRQA